MVKKILILTANPKGTSRRLEEEVREIELGLQRSQKRDQFVIKSMWAVRPKDFRRAMLDVEPQIVHFSGHGAGDGGLEFEDEKGQVKFVDAEGLAALFESFAWKVECVVLNACYSEIPAKAIARHVNYVIGMSQEIGDRAAIAFSVAFYDALGAGGSVEYAYQHGCAAIRLEGILENLTPKLLTKNPNIPKPKPDNTRLGDLLAAGKWKQADKETANLLLKVANREEEGWLRNEDMEKFSCQDLRTIDDLWVKYSNGHFGFSVQQRIWQEIGGKVDHSNRASFGGASGVACQKQVVSL